MQCPVCRFDNQDSDKRCRRCGQMLSAKPSGAPPKPQAPPASQTPPKPQAPPVPQKPPVPQTPPKVQAPPQAPPPQTPPIAVQPDVGAGADVTQKIEIEKIKEKPQLPPEEIKADQELEEEEFPEERGRKTETDFEGYGPRSYQHAKGIEFFTGKTGTTDAPTFLCFFIGLFLTVFWYLVFPVPISKPGYFYDIFADRGAIPYIITGCLFWGLALLLFKSIRFMIQKSVLSKELFPPDFKELKTTNVSKVMKFIMQQYPDPKEKIVVNRMWVALVQFKQFGKPEEVSNVIQYQADIDYGGMESSYTIIKFLVWVTPILGFLGTVIGIGTAIGGFTEVVSSAVEISAIKGALQVVTSGLSTAFDTTLLGLIVSLVMMFMMSFLSKSEETFLEDTENFFITQVLHRMKPKVVIIDGEEVDEGIGAEAKIYKKIIESAFKKHMDLLDTAFTSWGTGFSDLVGKMGEKTEGINKQIASTEPLVTDFRKALEDFSQEVKGTSENQKDLIVKLDERYEKVRPAIENLTKVTAGFERERENIDSKFQAWMQTVDNLNTRVADNFDRVTGNFDNQIKRINEDMNNQFRRIGDNLAGSMEKVGTQAGESFVRASTEVTGKLERMGENLVKEMDQYNKEQSDQIVKMADKFSQNLTGLGDGIMEKFGKSAQAFEGIREGQTKFFQESTETFSSNLTRVSDNIISKFDNQLGIFEDFRTKQSEYMEKQGRDMNRIVESITTDMGGQSENIKKIADGVSKQSKELLEQLNAQMMQLQNFSSSYEQGLESMTGKLEEISKETVDVFGNNVQQWFEAFSVQQSSLAGDMTQQVAEGVQGLAGQLLEGFGEQITTWFNSFSNDQSGYFNSLSNSLGENLNEAGGELLVKMDTYSNEVSGLIEHLSAYMAKNQQVLESLIQQVAKTGPAQEKGVEALETLNRELRNISLKHDETISRLSETGTVFRQGIESLTKSIASQQEVIKSLIKP